MNAVRISTTLALRARTSASASGSASASAMWLSLLPVEATTTRGLRRRRSITSVIAIAAPTMMTMKHPLSPLAKSNSCCCCCWHPPISHLRRWHSSSAPRPSASTTEKLNENDKSNSNSIRSSKSQSSLLSSLSNTNAELDTTISVIEEPPRRTILTPPVTTTTNTDQLYESRSEMVGFDVHDGTVPTMASAMANRRRSRQHRSDASETNADGDSAKSGQQQYQQQSHRRDKKDHGSLMDPYYVPPQEGMTHLIQGGTPCDIAVAGSRHRQPYRLAEYGEESVYTLILLRHGESEWNALNQYTGWCDVNLTRRGEGEARAAGRLLAENGIEIDHAFTSVLKRASYTTNMCLNMAGQHWVPVTKTWRLNERHYGALQGYNKDTAWEQLNIDQELVMEMRRSYAIRPPRMTDDHPYWHGDDRRYAKLTPEQLEKTRSESLKDAAERIMPFFNSVIVPSMREGNRCLVVSHANTIRTLIKQIDNVSDQDIKQLSIPTGIPLIYRLDRDMKPVDPNCELEFRYLVEPKGYTWATSRQHGFHGVYLGDLERLQDIQKKRDATNRGWQRVILRNIAKQMNKEDLVEDDTCYPNPSRCFHGEDIVETTHLWWKIVQKMQNPEFANMLLLLRMKEFLESLIAPRRSRNAKIYRYIPLEAYEKILEKIHLHSTGQVVDPFVSLKDRADREERQRRWIENLNVVRYNEEDTPRLVAIN